MNQTITINTAYKLIGGINQLGVEAGTNAPRGGDSGHGGRTFVRITEEGGTDWRVVVTSENGDEETFDNPSAFSIVLGGDSELTTIIQALEFAVAALKGLADGIQKSREVTL